MEKKPPLLLTPFDQMVTDDFLQMIKLVIPYLPQNLRYLAGIYVKMTEFTNAAALRRYPTSKRLSMDTFLDEMQPYLPEESRQFFEMFEMMQNIDFSDIMQSMDFGDISNMYESERNENDERMAEPPSTSESGSGETGAV